MTPIERWNTQPLYDINNDCAMDDESRQEFTDAINHCLDLLRENNYITDINMDVISRRAAVVGQEIYEYIKQMITKELPSLKSPGKYDKRPTPQSLPPPIQIVSCEDTINNFIKEEPIEIVDTQQPDNFIEPKPVEFKTKRRIYSRSMKKVDLNEDDNMETTNIDDTDTTVPTVSCKKREYKLIPLDVKSKVINIAHSNPTWGLKELRKYGCQKLTSMNTLSKWKLHVKSGGTKLEKLNMINRITYSRYMEACNNNQIVTTPMIRQWAMKAAEKYLDGRFKFEASHPWIYKFKLQHGIPSDDPIAPSDKELFD